MNNFNKILISIALVIILGAMYAYTSGHLSFGADKAYGGFLVSSNEDSGDNAQSINQDISFISTLASLNNIKIDTSVFSSPLFLNLVDNKVIINPIDPGRTNPFAPINKN